MQMKAYKRRKVKEKYEATAVGDFKGRAWKEAVKEGNKEKIE